MGPRIGYEGRGPDNPNTHYVRRLTTIINFLLKISLENYAATELRQKKHLCPLQISLSNFLASANSENTFSFTSQLHKVNGIFQKNILSFPAGLVIA